ncbi:AraC family transcriptional regulator [Bacillus sp. BHET2]|uniref:AraC family transcriptional regulator n=1 Tax=Bacillus sp. BHET2 TaxID=2583818 RepID=UPI00110D653F|nr:AraC family transcriptional regulator [Bacillus sp. BHET2]TMU85831.1 AraC family transcriptional regulator [Bacillus sp. BHET2]
MIQTETVHILNGTEMYKRFRETEFLETEEMIPLNEAMCYGETCENIFSDEFIELRSRLHHVTPGQYADITLKPLQPLFERTVEHICLWFDEDMFCQMNVLTILAWLDQRKYKGSIDLHLVDHQYKPVNVHSLEAKGYTALYEQVMLHKTMPEEIELKPLHKGIDLYLNYLNKDSELMLYIQKHGDVPAEELVSHMIRNFKEYGLGDTQYIEMIEDCRRNPSPDTL